MIFDLASSKSRLEQSFAHRGMRTGQCVSDVARERKSMLASLRHTVQSAPIASSVGRLLARCVACRVHRSQARGASPAEWNDISECTRRQMENTRAMVKFTVASLDGIRVFPEKVLPGRNHLTKWSDANGEIQEGCGKQESGNS
jgi:hypothetical protein